MMNNERDELRNFLPSSFPGDINAPLQHHS
jgi:hypothetical protein